MFFASLTPLPTLKSFDSPWDREVKGLHFIFIYGSALRQISNALQLKV